MNGKARQLKGKGEFDYDYAHDIIFFKVRNRNYNRSIEFENLVFDVDDENFIVGLQIFEASEYFNIPKKHLRIVTKWQLMANVNQIAQTKSRIEIRLFFEIRIRNRIVQPEPIITHDVDDKMEDSKTVCVPIKN